MAFYIKPTDGVISLNNLERFGRKRLIFLSEILRCDGTEGFKSLINKLETTLDSDCLIEGSKRDRASHFLLRLVCSENAEMKNFLIKAETELFCYRFSNMNTTELTRVLKSTHKFVSSCLRFKSCAEDEVLCDLYMTFEMIYTSVGSWKSVVKKYMDDCTTETFQIPFQLALSLIANRQILVTKGLAHVPFSELHVILSSLFHSVLCKGMIKAGTVSSLYQDDKKFHLLRSLRTFCRKFLCKPLTAEFSPGQFAIIRDQINQEAKCFPPCMYHPYRVLQERHRLRHHSRIQFTLFLKEVGLPIHEALSFWKEKYSLPERDKSGKEIKCERSWQKDNKRYVYNIRHLYGLEGSRTNYNAHSCKYLQTYTPGPGEVGGCPFSQSDENHLAYLMDIEDIGKSQQKPIQDLSKAKRFSVACKEYHKLKLSHLLEADKDETERKRKEEILHLNEERLGLVENTVIEGIIRSKEKLNNEEVTSLKDMERIGGRPESKGGKLKMKVGGKLKMKVGGKLKMKVGGYNFNEMENRMIIIDQEHKHVDDLKCTLLLEDNVSVKRSVIGQNEHDSCSVKRLKSHDSKTAIVKGENQFIESGYESQQVNRSLDRTEKRSLDRIGQIKTNIFTSFSQPSTSSGRYLEITKRPTFLKGYQCKESQFEIKESSDNDCTVNQQKSMPSSEPRDSSNTSIIEKRKEILSDDHRNDRGDYDRSKVDQFFHRMIYSDGRISDYSTRSLPDKLEEGNVNILTGDNTRPLLRHTQERGLGEVDSCNLDAKQTLLDITFEHKLTKPIDYYHCYTKVVSELKNM